MWVTSIKPQNEITTALHKITISGPSHNTNKTYLLVAHLCLSFRAGSIFL